MLQHRPHPDILRRASGSLLSAAVLTGFALLGWSAGQAIGQNFPDRASVAAFIAPTAAQIEAEGVAAIAERGGNQ